ncbi:hypothetical protein ABT336_11730 [Micromonospora sp. NPDC000207]|uniref:hypothetical protein n=1 Tax=Micromonospora sp. NPDC000207 TaxID=3154246 RepID=UPI003329BC9B
MPRIIVPAGLSMGPRFRYVRPPDPVAECYEIHLGDDLVELTETEAAVWAAAFHDAERHAKLEVNRESLIRLLETAPKPEPQATTLVDGLIERGLLVEFDTDGSLELVFRKHKLLPLGEGLGSTAEEPHLHRIGHAGQPKLAVPVDVYGLWSFSWRDSDLWQACVLYADDSENVAEGDEPSDATPQEVAKDLAVHLPLMIAMGCGYLDPVPS